MQFSISRSLLLLGAVARFSAAVDVNPNLPAGWTSKGCYTEANGGRALRGAAYQSGTEMTETACITFCKNKDYIYAGVEYGSECYCGNSFGDGSVKTALADCGMGCSGKPAEACGAGNRLNVFWSGGAEPSAPVTNPGPPGWTSLGCYTENNNGRALPVGVNTAGGSGQMTIALCTAACKAGNYKYAGAEYAGECFCGNIIVGGAQSVLTGCGMTCNGNSSEYCGGPNRLNVYQFGVTDQPTDVPTSTNNPPGGPTTTTTPNPPGATGLPTGWEYKGCYIDNANGGRILSKQDSDSPDMTVDICVAHCKAAGYKVAGIEYSTQCFCGNQLVKGGALASEDSQCGMNCGGNPNQKCGGPNRMSIYGNGPLTVLNPPEAQKTNLPGSWKYKSCVTEATGARAFKYQIVAPNTNDATSCLKQCSDFGFMAGGMEYGEECYCGDDEDLRGAGSTVRPDSECDVPCPGNEQYLCGGGNRISYYQWEGTPLYTWNYPQGNAAGEYRFFIGGVVIPLITVAGVNGKITFVEKYGTSTSGNSTGAYELDPSLVNDFGAAWREMHGLKTDVFCSAGLVLPDKAGRSINIGGWSGESTYGIRFYWPDGAPGVASQNQWEENYNEIHLQDGRWYPSALQLVNGSLLVVGGEEGSNGAPVPTLEVLPRAGGTLFCDWLQRTDPYNLYPFLAVLPGGGIFVAYYNEARILSADTFATTKTLPAIPGSVNNPLSGRTYPFEGTSMLLPQHAPFTAPLEILICGGSNPGPAIALDNCVTIAPEAPNPQWTLERMPSQRVMPCITALPDGTYLILNGARHGVAGFGLAQDPNLNAVLYDPSQPINKRMSVMANTTIARLYHSEAILMDDGQVLVTGSDPEDGTHPQEYRVEVFVPPYLLGGGARPRYTIGNKDWNYGQSVTFQLTSGAAAGIQVSLMGAVASTHGNSMGQRTLFPAVSCGGTTCTITAPPNANICPPGWYQLFVLSNGVPSTAQWVRIGGDPAGLGDWPPFNDFSHPGS